MDAVQGIAGFSTAASMAKVQMEVATKLLKLAQTAQAQPAAQLLSAATENMQNLISQMAGDLGGGFDGYA